MRILVTGAEGQLGKSLRTVLSGADAVFTDIVEGPGTLPLDITDLAAVRSLAEAQGIDTIVNCAAYTDVEGAEEHPEQAERLNAGAVEDLAQVMKERNGLLLHISSDYVFGADAGNTPHREDEEGKPTGVYGRSKLHGEEAVRRTGCRHVILRTSWLYSEYGKNFVKTMLRLLAGQKTVKVVFDQAGTPTYAGDLARAVATVLAAADTVPDGIYHYSNEGVCSWYDFAEAIAEYAGLTDCRIEACHSDEFPSKVHRPAYSVLDKSKFKARFGTAVPYWRDSLKTCVETLIH